MILLVQGRQLLKLLTSSFLKPLDTFDLLLHSLDKPLLGGLAKPLPKAAGSLTQRRRTFVDTKLRTKVLKVADNMQGTSSLTKLPYFFFASYALLTGSEKGLKDTVQTILHDEILTLEIMEVVQENQELVDQIRREFTMQEIQSFFKHDVLGLKGGREYDATPKSIIDLVLKILEINETDMVLDLGSGRGCFLESIVQEANPKRLYGVEVSHYNVNVAKIRTAVLGSKINYIEEDLLLNDYSNLDSTKVFSNFPWSVVFNDEQKEALTSLKNFYGIEFIPQKTDWYFVLKAYSSLRKGGKAVCLVTGSSLMRANEEVIRRALIERGAIEAVIALPGKLFENTSIPTNLLILSHGNESVRLVDASEIYQKSRYQNELSKENIEQIMAAYHGKGEHQKIASPKELAQDGFVLSPARYFLEREYDATPLGDLLLSIGRGVRLSPDELENLQTEEETHNFYLELTHIQDGMISNDLTRLKSIPEKYERYTIPPSNLVMTKNAPFRFAMANFKESKRVLGNGNLYVLDVNEEKINPVYLEAFLQSDLGQMEINRFAQGAAMKTVSIDDLKQIRVPSASEQKQKDIADQYVRLKERQKAAVEEIEEVERQRSGLFEEVGN